MGSVLTGFLRQAQDRGQKPCNREFEIGIHDVEGCHVNPLCYQR